MPEEKVSKRNNPDVSEWGSSGYIPVLPKPAADAGPRQCSECGHTEDAPRCPATGQVKPCNSYVCKFCYPQPKKHKATCNSGLAKYPNGIPEGVNADRNCDCGDRPPVPQEAAPQESSFVNWADEATAPDWAMRAARLAWEKLIRIYCKAEYRPLLDDAHVAEIAALIREAGSERERELHVELRQAIKAVRDKRGGGKFGKDDDGWWDLGDELEQAVETVLASRLLGGES